MEFSGRCYIKLPRLDYELLAYPNVKVSYLYIKCNSKVLLSFFSLIYLSESRITSCFHSSSLLISLLNYLPNITLAKRLKQQNICFGFAFWLEFFFFFFLHLLEGADSLSLLCLELVDSEFKLRVLGIEESSLQSCSMSSGTTGQGCLRLCLTASQL